MQWRTRRCLSDRDLRIMRSNRKLALGLCGGPLTNAIHLFGQSACGHRFEYDVGNSSGSEEKFGPAGSDADSHTNSDAEPYANANTNTNTSSYAISIITIHLIRRSDSHRNKFQNCIGSSGWIYQFRYIYRSFVDCQCICFQFFGDIPLLGLYQSRRHDPIVVLEFQRRIYARCYIECDTWLYGCIVTEHDEWQILPHVNECIGIDQWLRLYSEKQWYLCRSDCANDF